MSIRVMSQVWEHSRCRGGELLVLLAIADFAHDNGVAFPSVPVLARKARLGERHTTRVLQTLERNGELEIAMNKGPSGVNRYRILPYGDRVAPYGDAGVQQMVTPVSYEPSLIRQENLDDMSSGDVRPKHSKAERDSLWDALEQATGIQPEGIGERSLFGKNVKELLAVGASPNEVLSRAKRWPMRYPNATLTGRALVLHWGELAGRPKTKTVACDVCGERMSAEEMKAHHYDKHGVGRLCSECGEIVGPDEQHGHAV